jgi:hypothetical protein
MSPGTTLNFPSFSATAKQINGNGIVNVPGGMLTVESLGSGITISGNGGVTSTGASFTVPQTFTGPLVLLHLDATFGGTTLSAEGTVRSASSVFVWTICIDFLK